METEEMQDFNHVKEHSDKLKAEKEATENLIKSKEKVINSLTNEVNALKRVKKSLEAALKSIQSL